MRDHGQAFYAVPPLCQNVQVTVVQAHQLIKTPMEDQSGIAQRLIAEQRPDTYVVLKLADSLKSQRQTKIINNDHNPVWNETFDFWIDARVDNVMEIILMDANYGEDDIMGVQTHDLALIPINQEIFVTLHFNQDSTLEIKLYKTNDDSTPSLRFSDDLCQEEKSFLEKRKQKVFLGLQKLLGEENGPKTLDEVPTIAIMGSGGGFRAMVSLCGVLKALHNCGLLDCCTYAAGLSGSTWYFSTLYSSPDFPKLTTPKEHEEELKESLSHSPLGLLSPPQLYGYLNEIMEKRKAGQSVSFTDLFGLMLRDTLLTSRPNTRLSHQRAKLEEAAVPLPLYSCLNVKKNVQARVFHEWIEFSPYEIGIPKYGVFMRPEHFGCRFFLGRRRDTFPEYPLHYLQGVWGSAFCVVFRQLAWISQTEGYCHQLLLGSRKNDTEENLKKALDNFIVVDDDDVGCAHFVAPPNPMTATTQQLAQNIGDNARLAYSKLAYNANRFKGKAQERVLNAVQQSLNTVATVRSLPKGVLSKIGQAVTGSNYHPEAGTQTGFLGKMASGAVQAITNSQLLNDITGRAGCVCNPLFGIDIRPYFDENSITHTRPEDEETFKGIQEPLSTEEESIYLVDGGLAFNSPYPLLMRPQRGTRLILSFDFSSRPNDQTDPFRELLLAEDWARRSKTPFPPILQTIRNKYANLPTQEYYIFEDANDTQCPIIVHYAIINNRFRKFKAPGVPRRSAAEKKFADFSIFDDTASPYSTYNFKYTNEQFDRLVSLNEFNTLLSVDEVKLIITRLIRPEELHNCSEANHTGSRARTSNGLISRILNCLTSFFGGNSRQTRVRPTPLCH